MLPNEEENPVFSGKSKQARGNGSEGLLLRDVDQLLCAGTIYGALTGTGEASWMAVERKATICPGNKGEIDLSAFPCSTTRALRTAY